MKKSYKKILFSVITIIIVMVSVEAGLRVLYYFRTGRASHLLSPERIRTIRKIIPYMGTKSVATKEGDCLIKNGYYTYNPKIKSVQGGSVRINDLGFRGGNSARRDDIITVWCVGGSTTFGYGSKKSFPELLQEDLNKDGDRYAVINGGMPGMNGQHIYNMLRDKSFVDRVRPDVIVLNTYWNTIEQYENSMLIETMDNKILQAVLSDSTLAFLLYKAYVSIKYEELIGPFQALYIYVDKICSLAQKENFKVILLNEPMVLDDKAWMAAPEHPENHAKASKVFRYFHRKYKGEAFFVPIIFFDRLDYKDKATVNKFFIDKGHLTLEGNEKMAESLSKTIRRLEIDKRMKNA